MRYSKQRELILATLKKHPVHPTADALYAMLKKCNPALSLGTVYRNLNLLAKEGTILRLKGIDGSEHFDHNVFPHCHFICERCSEVEDVALPQKFTEVLKQFKKGYRVNACEVVLRGICSTCKHKTGDKK